MKKFIITLLTVIFIFIGLGLTYIVNRSNNTINSNDYFLIIKNEDSLENVASKLLEKKIIRSKEYLSIYKRIFNKDLKIKAGNYIIKPNTSTKDLLNKLDSGLSDFAIITIPEGYSLYQIADRLEKNNLTKKDEFMQVKLKDIDTGNLIKPSENTFYDLEGYLFPATYYIPFSYTKEQIAQTMFDNFSKVFSEQYRHRAEELGLSVNQVITIASLIEKETAMDQERSRISGVIYNRLKLEMPLQIDASIIYAITKGEKSIPKVTYSNLKVESKYNIYVNKGLPPGPIATPGKPSIEAALYPESHDYLYYVASENGHIFSKTYEEHINNINKLRK